MRKNRASACLAAGIALAIGCGGDESEGDPIVRPVRYVVVQDAGGAGVLNLSGAVEAADRTRLSFQVAGRIQELAIEMGDEVTDGQRIAALDPVDYELQLQEARATAAQASAEARNARAAYERVRALYSNQNASQADLDSARAARDGAGSAAGAASQAVRRLERQLEYATLSAPSGGTIVEVPVQANEVVSAGQVVAILQSGDTLQVAVDVPESSINRIAADDEVTIVLDALAGQTFDGKVCEIGVPAGGGTVFPVKVTLPEDATGIRTGMAATVTFRFEAEETTEAARFVLPVSAVGEDREGRFVFVVEPTSDGLGVVHRRSVEIGELTGSGIAISSGIETGDRIVTAGVSRIRDELEVQVPAPENASALPDDSGNEEPAASPEATDTEDNAPSDSAGEQP